LILIKGDYPLYALKPQVKPLKEEFKVYIEKNHQLAALFKQSDVITNDIIDDSKPIVIADKFNIYYKYNREIENQAQLTFLEYMIEDKDYIRILEEATEAYCCKRTEGFMQIYPMKAIIVRTIFSYLEVLSFLKEKGIVEYHLTTDKEIESLIKTLMRYAFFDKSIVPGVEFKKVSIFSEAMKSKIIRIVYSLLTEAMKDHAHLDYITDLDRTARYWYQERTESGLQEALARETEIDTIRLDELFPNLEVVLP
jgi:hypothetical protein